MTGLDQGHRLMIIVKKGPWSYYQSDVGEGRGGRNGG
jgi:hypothetical protein